MLLQFTTFDVDEEVPMRGIKIYQVSNLEPMWMMKRVAAVEPSRIKAVRKVLLRLIICIAMKVVYT